MRVVYAVLPFTIGMFILALAAVGSRLFYDTGAQWFRIGALVAAVAGFACMGWGVKEFVRPSSWRSRPPWLREYEARAKRRPT